MLNSPTGPTLLCHRAPHAHARETLDLSRLRLGKRPPRPSTLSAVFASALPDTAPRLGRVGTSLLRVLSPSGLARLPAPLPAAAFAKAWPLPCQVPASLCRQFSALLLLSPRAHAVVLSSSKDAPAGVRSAFRSRRAGLPHHAPLRPATTRLPLASVAGFLSVARHIPTLLAPALTTRW